MKEICKKRNSDPLPLSPQFFNDDDYCGVSTLLNDAAFFLYNQCNDVLSHPQDWEDFFAASDDDKIHSFLKLEEPVKCELTELPSSDSIIEAKAAEASDDLDNSDVNISDKNVAAFEEELNTDDDQIGGQEISDHIEEQESEEVEEEAITLSPTLDTADDEVTKDDQETYDEEAVEEQMPPVCAASSSSSHGSIQKRALVTPFDLD